MSRPRPPTEHHVPDEAEQRIESAAQWLAQQPQLRGIVHTLRQNFGLATDEAVAAIRKAERIRRGAS